jgi:hypothetical protein
MSKTLINSFEVTDKAPASHNLDIKQIMPLLVDVDFDLCDKECFGEDFYLALIDDLRPFDLFDACKVYALNDVVAYGAKYYELTVLAPAGTLPTDANFWTLTTKFLTAKYQSLWDDGYLCDYLVFGVLHYAVISTAVRFSSQGIQRNNTDFSEAAKKEDYLQLKNDFQNRREKRFMFMDKYLTRQTDTIDNIALYPLYPPNADACGCACPPKESTVNIPFPKRRRIRNHIKYKYNYYNNNGQCCED